MSPPKKLSLDHSVLNHFPSKNTRRLFTQVLGIAIVQSLFSAAFAQDGCIETRPTLYNYSGSYGETKRTIFFISGATKHECKLYKWKKKMSDTYSITVDSWKCTDDLLVDADSLDLQRGLRLDQAGTAPVVEILAKGIAYKGYSIPVDSSCVKGGFGSRICQHVTRELSCSSELMRDSFTSYFIIPNAGRKSFVIQDVRETVIVKQ